MWFHSTCRYPEQEVRALVEYGFAEIDHGGLAVRVKNTRHAYRGRAYESVPPLSPLAKDPSIARLVTIGLGPPSEFPSSNAVTSAAWLRVKPGEVLEGVPRSQLRHARPRGARGRRATPARSVEPALERRVVRTHGYGGVGSPIVQLADWREALVAVAAHEARHIWQYQHDAPRSEVDAERYSVGRLLRWRERGLEP